MEEAVGPDHPDVANILNSLAGIHEDRGVYAVAEELYRRAVRLMEHVAGGDPDTERLRLQSLGNLAGCCRAQGRYKEAKPLFLEALTTAEKTFGRDDLEVSATLNNLAVLYKYMGRFAEAGRLYQRALTITEKALGPDHPEV